MISKKETLMEIKESIQINLQFSYNSFFFEYQILYAFLNKNTKYAYYRLGLQWMVWILGITKIYKHYKINKNAVS